MQKNKKKTKDSAAGIAAGGEKVGVQKFSKVSIVV
jgi:hypothetical protein